MPDTSGKPSPNDAVSDKFVKIIRIHDLTALFRVFRLLFQSSSASRFTAGAAGFLILSQSLTRPDV